MKVSCIIVGFNDSNDFPRLAESLGGSFEIIVVDNSTNGGHRQNYRILCQKFQANYVGIDDNPGYGCACNIGADTAKGDWLLFLNADCWLEPDFFFRLEKSLLPMTEAAGLSIREYDGDRITGNGSLDIDLAGHPISASPAQDYVDCYSGFLLIRKSTFQSLGGMDHRLFLYGEEWEFSLRLMDRGVRIQNLHTSRIHHRQQTALRKLDARARYYANRNHAYTILKHFRGLHVPIALGFHALFCLLESFFWLCLLRPISAWRVGPEALIDAYLMPWNRVTMRLGLGSIYRMIASRLFP